MKQTYKIILISIIFIVSLISASAQEFKVIVHNSNTTSSLTKKQVSDFLLKKKTRWPDKTKVLPVDLGSKSAVRSAFTKQIHKKNVSQIRSFWQQSVFSGKASPPSEKTNDEAVINYVKTHKGAIGYISSKAKATGVKIVTVK